MMQKYLRIRIHCSKAIFRVKMLHAYTTPANHLALGKRYLTRRRNEQKHSVSLMPYKRGIQSCKLHGGKGKYYCPRKIKREIYPKLHVPIYATACNHCESLNRPKPRRIFYSSPQGRIFNSISHPYNTCHAP